MVLNIILTLIVLVNGTFAVKFIKNLLANKNEAMNEPGNPIAMAISSFTLFFLSTFGISDFAISTVLYRKLKWTSDKKLPGTLNTQCVIPVAVMALSYISSISVELKTLIIAILAQVLGAYIGPRFVVKMNVDVIKKFISVGLLIAAGLILMGKFGVYPSGGNEVGLAGFKLISLGILSFVFGALNNVGIGSYALTMATVYALGLNPGVAFPIMMGACTFSVPVGSMQFVKYESYSRKITLFTSIFGSIGVLVAAFIVKSMNVSMLQWLVVAVLIYSAITMISDIRKAEKSDVKVTA
ncbi:sulfite exporter TauE/SafE family protein [Senegalia massiliensis]|uniref:Anion permease n=1 Tax=Senegalia massiliensis TaxID=1720316 RepID=A0A845QU34_9CLOT|nr:sulfite exporter TauE/SafE family protein [Senegalia massiliensis]NBI05544.1 anion permease [Senegalia massiliensis]